MWRSGSSGKANDAAKATPNVTVEPMNAYQVHAVAPVHQTHTRTTTPAIMPVDHRARADARREHADQKRAEHRAGGERQHRQAGVEHRPDPLRAERDRNLHDAPDDRRRRDTRISVA